MSRKITEDQVVDAAQKLDESDFTRGQLAEALGVEKPDLKQGFRAARKEGRLEKTRDDEEGVSHFRLIAASDAS